MIIEFISFHHQEMTRRQAEDSTFFVQQGVGNKVSIDEGMK